MKLVKIFLCFSLCFSLIDNYGQQVPDHLDCVKINHLYRKACHNCFEHSVITTFAEALDETLVVELDINSHETNGSEASVGVWYVRHPPANSNNKNNCINKLNNQSDQNFNICLENVQDWSIAHPGHDPIIVFIDLKPNYTTSDFWRPNHGTTDLDNVLKQFAMNMGGLDVLYKPSDLRGSFLTTREAAQNENWPSLGNMKNKFVFVLTGDNLHLNEYMTNVGNGAMAFVAVNIDAFANSSNGYIPFGFNYSNSQEIIFYNLKDNQTAALSSFIPSNGLMSRSWQEGNTTQSQYGGSIAAKVNNIAIKNIYANNLNTFMDYQLIGINNITIGGSSSNPHHISSQYNSILQHALIKLTVQDLIVQSGTTYNLRAGEEVDLLPGVDIQPGSNTDISIGTCADYSNNLRTTNTIPTEIENLTEQEIKTLMEDPLVYPNPAQSVVYIDYSNTHSEQAIFNLYDITGRLLKTYETTNSDNQIFTLNINDLKEGTYFYTLQIGKQIKNGKLVKIN